MWQYSIYAMVTQQARLLSLVPVVALRAAALQCATMQGASRAPSPAFQAVLLAPVAHAGCAACPPALQKRLKPEAEALLDEEELHLYSYGPKSRQVGHLLEATSTAHPLQ